MESNVQKKSRIDRNTINKVSDLVFGVDVQQWTRLPLPGTDSERLIMNEYQLTQYQAWYGNERIERRGNMWVIPAFEVSRKQAIERKAATLAKWNTTE